MDITTKEILELVHAGFTKEEIMSFKGEPVSDSKESASDPAPAESSEGGKEEEVPALDNNADSKKKEPASSKDSKLSSDTAERMISKMDEMINTMRASNRDAVENTLQDTQSDFMKAASEFLGGTLE